MEPETENPYHVLPGAAKRGAAESSSRMRPYYGWVIVLVAAWAMVATLPGRSMGLGLIVEPLLKSFNLNHVQFGWINLTSILIGAAFCVPIGAALDRWGPRIALAGVTAALGAVVVLTARVESVAALVLLLTLTRGLGECSLSVLSISLVGKWFSRRLSMAMGIYSVLMAIGFLLAFGAFGAFLVLATRVLTLDEFRQGGWWRDAWSCVGWSILVPGPLLALLLLRAKPRDSPGFRDEFPPCGDPRDPAPAGHSSSGIVTDGAFADSAFADGASMDGASMGGSSMESSSMGGVSMDNASAEAALAESVSAEGALVSFTLRQSLATPAFWCFALGVAVFGLLNSAISIYNQSLLVEQGFADHRPEELLGVMFPAGIVLNLVGGWLGSKVPLGRLLGAAMLVLAGSVALFPTITTWNGVMLYGLVFGGAGGVVTVTFFSIWAKTFGHVHLGKIQGAAQVCSVLASATGPLLLAKCHERFGGYAPFFQTAAVVAALVGLACILAPTPRRELAS